VKGERKLWKRVIFGWNGGSVKMLKEKILRKNLGHANENENE
jgi:hypothetical protein